MSIINKTLPLQMIPEFLSYMSESGVLLFISLFFFLIFLFFIIRIIYLNAQVKSKSREQETNSDSSLATFDPASFAPEEPDKAEPEQAEPEQAKPENETLTGGIDGLDYASDGLSEDKVSEEAREELQRGLEYLEAANLDEAEKCLESALSEAGPAGDLTALCETRYHLAIVNKQMGDLTLACEHWQIARELYQIVRDKQKVAEIEEYMRESGCPTDWVLNAL